MLQMQEIYDVNDGIIIVNKPPNCTSHDIVARIKKITQKKVGHTGTLDPLAQGVLPILLGKGTLCSKYLINHDKTYKVTIKLGETTKTLDREGEIIEKREISRKIFDKDFLENNIRKFVGKQEQTPPIYSAIKVNGKKLYEYARKGQDIEIKPRNIEIYDIQINNINSEENEITLIVKCSKGTYIRSLCKDISEKIGTIGYMKELQRLQVGEFTLENSITLENDEQMDIQEIMKNIITIEQIFLKNDKIELEQNKLKHFLNGVKITVNKSDGIYRIYKEDNIFIGIGIVEHNLLKRDIIL